MQSLIVSKFINADKAGGEKFGYTFAKGFVIALLATVLVANPHHKAIASAAEHQAVLDLVPVAGANRTVAQSGAWSSPATWSGGFPSAGDDIYVPEGKTLVVDVTSNVSLGTLRVDGTLKFATNKFVRIKVDTLVVTTTGTFEVGSETARVANNKRVEIIIANNGPINRTWDPINISRGVILQGKTRIFGSEKSPFHKLSVDPAAGSTQLTLSEVPTGWVKGDIIAITATKFRRKQATDTSYQTEDELRRINAISGNVITLGSVNNSAVVEPLQLSHIPDIADMPVYAANLTRNVLFTGEGGDAVPVSQRGHFMVMHAPDTVIKGAGFYHLGRTDKSIPINDFKLDAKGFRLTDAQGNYIPDANTNPRGRYAVHFHHTGIDPSVPPVICSGNAVISSQGLGFVNHESNVAIENNASYNVLGSHFFTEDGNEIGSFKHNIAIKSSGRADTSFSSGAKTGAGNHDHGHSAHGFWFQGRNLAIEDNVVSGTYGPGMMFYNRNKLKELNLEIPAESLMVPNDAVFKGMPTIDFQHVPAHVKKLTVVASFSALVTVKEFEDSAWHDVHSVFESIKGYSVLRGIVVEYSAKQTFKDIELYADPTTDPWYVGFNMSRNVRDVVVIDAKIDGFVHPIATGTVFRNAPDQTDAVFVNVMIDGSPMAAARDIHQPTGAVISNYDPAAHTVLTAMPTVSTLAYTPSSAISYDLPATLTSGFMLKGIKTDGFGKSGYTSGWPCASLVAIVKNGYYTRPNGSRFVILSHSITDRVTGRTMDIKTRANVSTNFSFLGPHLGTLPN